MNDTSLRRRKRKFAAWLGWSYVLLGSLICANSASALPAQGDYDGDGRSDLAVAEVNRGLQTTSWFVRLTSGAPSLGFNFAGAADAFVTGRYFRNDPRVYPGIVRVKDQTQPLAWTIKTPSGADASMNYGVPGDIIPNQGDLDCDGITDLVVTRNGTGIYQGFKLWYVALSAKPGAVQQMLFGLATDHVATADMDGDGCSELLVLRENFHWFSRKLFQEGVTDVQWGLPGDIPLVPQDMTGDGIADYIVTRNFGGVQYALVRLPDGSTSIEQLGNSTAVPLVGNFIGVNFFAWLERATSFIGVGQFDRVPVVFPFSLPTNWLIRPDGTVVPPLVAPAPAPAPTAPASNGNDGVRCDGEIARNDGSGGFKNNAQNSRGTIKVMFPKKFTGNIAAVEALFNGKVIDTLDEGSTLEWGDRERYYGNKSLRSYPHDLLIRLTTRTGRAYCVTLPDPSKTYD
ncbi:MAG: hypothetical protein U0136_12815 [Bdellovibrionota bacterium]